jgi:hypothetical protein
VVVGTGMGAGTGVVVGTGMGAGTGVVVGTGTGEGTGVVVGTGMGAGTGVVVGTGMGAGTGVVVGTGMGAGTGAGTVIVMDTDVGTGADVMTGKRTGKGAGSGTGFKRAVDGILSAPKSDNSNNRMIDNYKSNENMNQDSGTGPQSGPQSGINEYDIVEHDDFCIIDHSDNVIDDNPISHNEYDIMDDKKMVNFDDIKCEDVNMDNIDDNNDMNNNNKDNNTNNKIMIKSNSDSNDNTGILGSKSTTKTQPSVTDINSWLKPAKTPQGNPLNITVLSSIDFPTEEQESQITDIDIQDNDIDRKVAANMLFEESKTTKIKVDLLNRNDSEMVQQTEGKMPH